MVQEDKSYVEEDIQKDRYLTFLLGEYVYAVEIRCVTEIIGVMPITKIPETPNFVKGVINLRGQIVPIMDMRLKLHKEETVYTDRTCIIVVDIETIVLGLIVDSVVEVLTIAQSDTVPPPDFCKGGKNPYIKAVDNTQDCVKLILDSSRLLIDEELLEIENIKNEGEQYEEV